MADVVDIKSHPTKHVLDKYGDLSLDGLDFAAALSELKSALASAVRAVARRHRAGTGQAILKVLEDAAAKGDGDARLILASGALGLKE